MAPLVLMTSDPGPECAGVRAVRGADVLTAAGVGGRPLLFALGGILLFDPRCPADAEPRSLRAGQQPARH
jgi:hypothetical protein